MDFRLAQKKAKNYLRDVLAFNDHWVYYAIMILDPLLRMTWVLQAIFTNSIQHASGISFAVALLEIVRRGGWLVFRVENEHCVNIAHNKAHRDIPLPYKIHVDEE